jgi:hypothetical protein
VKIKDLNLILEKQKRGARKELLSSFNIIQIILIIQADKNIIKKSLLLE